MIQANPTAQCRLLILDADRIALRAMAEQLRRQAYDVRTADNLPAALAEMDAGGVDVLLADLDLPGVAPDELLADLRRRFKPTPVLVMSRYGTVESAKSAARHGASDYLTKPVETDELHAALRHATRHQALLAEDLRPLAADADPFGDIIGRDLAMQRVFDTAAAVADSRTNVLILGESGTGKSLLARAIHRQSPRRDRPFVEVACGGLPDTLLESELFGHVKGAFTNAVNDKAGRFVTADTGTLFLDEINSAPPAMQTKLLRVLQERRLEAVGSDTTRTVDVRTVLASNADLAAMVAAGTFRQDLYYRINVVTLRLPPLRARPGDIPLLTERFLQKFTAETGRRVVGFTPAAKDALVAHPWPGNVRELENAIERAVVLSRRPTIDAEDLFDGSATPASFATTHPPAADYPLAGAGAGLASAAALPLSIALEAPERDIITAALERNRWNRQSTAAELAIDRTTLYKKMRKYGLDGGGRN